MAKRFTDTEKWNDDWYISLSNDYRIIWQWLVDNCNHAGICKRSIKILNLMCNTDITESEMLAAMHDRVLLIDDKWFIPKFLKFQYSNLTSNKPAIVSVAKELLKTGFNTYIPESFGNDYLIIKQSLDNDSRIIKDKDKDKDTVLNNNTQSSNRYKSENKKVAPVVFLAGLWMEANPSYQFHQNYDYTALREMFEFLMGGELSNVPEYQLADMMGMFITAIRNHKFYKDKPLAQMKSGIQGIKQAMFTMVDKMVY